VVITFFVTDDEGQQFAVWVHGILIVVLFSACLNFVPIIFSTGKNLRDPNSALTEPEAAKS
jgi:uncharacterized membrane protein